MCCPYNSHRDSQYKECVCDNDYYWNDTSKQCIKNYSISNWIIVGSPSILGVYNNTFLCTNWIYYIGFDNLFNLPHNASQACDGTQCYWDYIAFVNWDSQFYECVGYAPIIKECETSDYSQYCRNNPGKVCLVSYNNEDCREWSAYIKTEICDPGCWGAPYDPWDTYHKTCKANAVYVQCKQS